MNMPREQAFTINFHHTELRLPHPDTQKALPEIKPENATEQQPAQADDKLEDIVSVVRDTIDMRIDETNELLQKVGNAINNMSSSLQQTTSSTLEMEVRDLQRQVADLRARID
ncbi:15770_t:CDS:2 [Entrophospora sp. SA101]|nr:15770_t:CDS:2 [Entrophospora sp. SA101]